VGEKERFGMIDFSKIDAGELNQALISAHDEIISLRARLAAAEPKAHAYDTISQLSRLTVTHEERGYGIDVAWRIKNLLERAKAKEEADAEQAPA
jgi:hypothetical protein